MPHSRLIPLATVDALKPGKMQLCLVEGLSILLANIGGELYAVDAVCSHEDALLSNGALMDDCVKCPLHGSRFHLKTGQAMEEPATAPLRTYPLLVQANQVFLVLYPDA